MVPIYATYLLGPTDQCSTTSSMTESQGQQSKQSGLLSPTTLPVAFLGESQGVPRPVCPVFFPGPFIPMEYA